MRITKRLKEENRGTRDHWQTLPGDIENTKENRIIRSWSFDFLVCELLFSCKMGETLGIACNVFEKAERERDRKERMKALEDWNKEKRVRMKRASVYSKSSTSRQLSDPMATKINSPVSVAKRRVGSNSSSSSRMAKSSECLRGQAQMEKNGEEGDEGNEGNEDEDDSAGNHDNGSVKSKKSDTPSASQATRRRRKKILSSTNSSSTSSSMDETTASRCCCCIIL
ncbi:hypothetical protein TCAL_01140 [Tigriopus californicus]|uniref:Uncharacterized protein n=2 Tax=Tigriopus californicus TaxID=6832 RepID=A0A553P2N6_TIGCA|nr:hypothetical protein TCAL_01140 [Tigriopus californicus]